MKIKKLIVFAVCALGFVSTVRSQSLFVTQSSLCWSNSNIGVVDFYEVAFCNTNAVLSNGTFPATGAISIFQQYGETNILTGITNLVSTNTIPGVYSFAIRTWDTNGFHSGWSSNFLVKLINAPNAPGGLKIQKY